MAAPKTIALDAMGGDHGPEIVVPGAALSLERHPELKFIFCGDSARINAALAPYAGPGGALARRPHRSLHSHGRKA